jgi:uncharacterized membrane protein YGL010W
MKKNRRDFRRFSGIGLHVRRWPPLRRIAAGSESAKSKIELLACLTMYHDCQQPGSFTASALSVACNMTGQQKENKRMKTLTEQLSQYAGYHRDKRNVLTHFVGIPMIVLAVLVFLSRWIFLQVAVPVGEDVRIVSITFALIAGLLVSLYYLRLDVRYGLTMTLLIGAACWVASQVAKQSFSTWLIAGVALFVVGWIFQFVGHHFEGKKPAFVDDLMGLIIGPLFVVAEAGFLLGLRQEVNAEVVRRSGPLH